MPGPVWLPEVVGDPEGMRRLARELRNHADNVAHLGDRCTRSVDAMTFDGPAGDRFRTRMQSFGRATSSAADRLQSVAGTLERSAAEVQQAQEDRLRRLDQMMREYLESKRTAGVG